MWWNGRNIPEDRDVKDLALAYSKLYNDYINVLSYTIKLRKALKMATEQAPDGQQWRCKDCGHHAKLKEEVPGLCEHNLELIDESVLQNKTEE